LTAGGGAVVLADVALVAVTVLTVLDSELSESSLDRVAFQPTRAKAMPRNSSTITIARMGNPEGSR
jgi:hypothetical protein